MMVVSLEARFEKFFDRVEVIKLLDRKKHKALRLNGGRIRKIARRSIRKRKRSAEPGSPPSSHSGRLRRGIYFSYDEATDSVVVGPELDGIKNAAAEIEEKFPFMGPAFEINQTQYQNDWEAVAS